MSYAQKILEKRSGKSRANSCYIASYEIDKRTLIPRLLQNYRPHLTDLPPNTLCDESNVSYLRVSIDPSAHQVEVGPENVKPSQVRMKRMSSSSNSLAGAAGHWDYQLHRQIQNKAKRKRFEYAPAKTLLSTKSNVKDGRLYRMSNRCKRNKASVSATEIKQYYTALGNQSTQERNVELNHITISNGKKGFKMENMSNTTKQLVASLSAFGSDLQALARDQKLSSVELGWDPSHTYHTEAETAPGCTWYGQFSHHPNISLPDTDTIGYSTISSRI